MKIHDQDTQQTPSSTLLSTPARKRSTRFASIGAVLVVLVIVGLSITVFTLLKVQRNGVGTTPPAGKWIQVLNGYNLSSLVSAPSNPSMLYACAAPTSPASTTSYTIMRSSDFGTHWQAVTDKLALVGDCHLAVNPASSNDLYAVGGATDGSHAVTLYHTTDSGTNWAALTPTISAINGQTATPWNVQQLSVVGNTLFGLQWMSVQLSPPLHPNGASTPQSVRTLARLIRSTDGGVTWTVVNSHFTAQTEAVLGYVVHPTDPNTLYELIGTPWYPVQPSPQGAASAYGLNESLYKTTDGGATWTLLLTNLHYGSSVQVASSDPNIVYVGGSIGPLPLTPQSPTGVPSSSTQSTLPTPSMPTPSTPATVTVPSGSSAIGNFHVRRSTDGGASWRDVPKPAQLPSVQDWFVSADGTVYASSGFSTYGSGAGVSATVVTITGVKNGTSSSTSSTSSSDTTSGTGSDTTPIATGTVAKIVSLAPTATTWNTVTQAPTYGLVIAITPANKQSGAILWLMSTTHGKQTVYRYVA